MRQVMGNEKSVKEDDLYGMERIAFYLSPL
jgi:hypothetical protein